MINEAGHVKRQNMVDISELTFHDVVGYTASGVMIFGGVVPYIPQYREIKKKEDAEGFSLYVCLALLIANSLRIFFWFGKRFELPLLLQSILMIVTMLIMIRVCITVRNKNHIVRPRERVFTDFQSYMDFMLVFGVVGGLITYLLGNNFIFIEFVGSMAVLTEAMLGVPQFLRNFRNKSTKGMSIAMVIMWACGDSFKTFYFIYRQAPTQFGVCGALQVMIDIAILAQVYLYRNSTAPTIKAVERD